MKGTKRTMATKEQQDKAWNNAKRIRGKDPDNFRQDPYGNLMNRSAYGKATQTGWEVDHIMPESRGGADSTRNLQALNTILNREKGDSLKKKSRHSKSNQ